MSYSSSAFLAAVLIGWSLVAPAQAPTKGTVLRSPLPTAGVCHIYESNAQCEQDRDFLQRDLNYRHTNEVSEVHSFDAH
jgi:hypothetical protein